MPAMRQPPRGQIGYLLRAIRGFGKTPTSRQLIYTTSFAGMQGLAATTVLAHRQHVRSTWETTTN